MVDLFSKTIGMLEKTLDVRSERHRVITANIANQDTPGYKAMEVNFKKALDEVLNAAPGSLLLALQRTDPAHFSPRGTTSATSHATPSAAPSHRLDGNTVNAEMEMAKLAENNLLYTASAQFISGKFRGIRNAIKEGR